MSQLEVKLDTIIKELYQEITNMRPNDGFNSPRDFGLVKKVNKKGAVLAKLKEAMLIYNPRYKG